MPTVLIFWMHFMSLGLGFLERQLGRELTFPEHTFTAIASVVLWDGAEEPILIKTFSPNG